MSSFIRLRGGRQNNLKGVDLDLPHGEFIVVTGPSGSGKSSLAFDTLYAEGQRRYIETFSPYTRQFLDRMDKPQADKIEGIPPAIALAQANNVRTTRSTVGTITEINDYLKLLFPRATDAICPECDRPVSPSTAQGIVEEVMEGLAGEMAVVTFGVNCPAGTEVADFMEFLRGQGFLRVYLFGKVVRTDEPTSRKKLPAVVPVVQDRVEVTSGQESRLAEAVEAALRLGQGKLTVHSGGKSLPFSSGWHCAHCDLDLTPPSPGLFSFNNPLGACPECRGFGRVIGVDLQRVMPDKTRSIAAGVVKPFQSGQSQECQKDLLRAAARREVDVHARFCDLPDADQKWVIEGDLGDAPEEAWKDGGWYGVNGYFRWLESKTYKMHVRVLLSRYRSYCACPSCDGGRYQPATLNFRLRPSGLTLPQVNATPIRDLIKIFAELSLKEDDQSSLLLHQQISSRLHFLKQVGLEYLTLDRPTRSLSGGELERVNLTACLGASLTNTLFVLDEPSVGLHPRDTARLIQTLQALRDKGNTLVVVEHEEAVIRAGDYLVDVGPGRGESGGEVVYAGSAAGLSRESAPASLTRAYLDGEKQIEVPAKRRKATAAITLKGVRHNNLQGVDVEFPLGVFCCVTGVSGSGKSSLVHEVLYRNLQGEDGTGEVVGHCDRVRGATEINDVVMVGQSPLARSPRSTPAVYIGAFDRIRELFGTLPESLAAGLSPAVFSFNAGDGRCPRCSGLGFEKVEMQFLSDLYLRCPECGGKRYQDHILAIKLREKSIADVLEMTVDEAIEFFAPEPQVTQSLAVLKEVGLGYLRLGQPVNELSGGESQRLKLAAHLTSRREKGALLIFDEPTTGLHFDDIAILLKVFQRLVEGGDHLIVIEHNLEVIKSADWLVDLGPGAGDEGGRVVATGTPEQVALSEESETGKFLAQHLTPRGRLAETPKSTALSKRPTPPQEIVVRGAREHNLKNLNLTIPHGKVVVVTGLSGSGKSTLAFDVLFAEGQRRFLDSMSAYARQFVEQLEKPEVDSIEGLPPSVAIEQRVTRGGGKSTVATVTEIYHFLRLLFAKLGTQYCPDCHVPVRKQTPQAIAAAIRKLVADGKATLLAPLVRGRKGFHTRVADWAGRQGIETLIVDGQPVQVSGFQRLERFKEHVIDAVIAEVVPGMKNLTSLVKRALKFGQGTVKVIAANGEIHVLSSEMNCPSCDASFEPLHPRLFSFNSPHGWCPQCKGYGLIWKPVATKEHDSVLEAELAEEKSRESLEETEVTLCPECLGSRLNRIARNVEIQGVSITDITGSAALRAGRLLNGLRFRGTDQEVAHDILGEINRRLKFLERVGLEYLALDRAANTLSGGESQRIRLAAQLGSNLRGVLYVLDEPTIGLHARDNGRLLDALCELAEGGNSLVVVEHDEDTMRRADHIIDLGPGAGALGGEVVSAGSYSEVIQDPASLTGQALAKPAQHPLGGQRRSLKNAEWLELEGGTLHNLENVSVRVPLNRLTVVTGVSGSGKSSLVRGILEPAVRSVTSRARPKQTEAEWKAIKGANELGGVLLVDQSPIGKTSRSTPATYIKVLDSIRKLYAELPTARMRGYSASRFSFNNEGGRCEACLGQGVIKMEMSFLPPSYMPCEECGGQRYNRSTLEVTYNGYSIGDVMKMTAAEALEVFSSHPKVKRSRALLVETGLGYLQLGQPSPTLSGGEAQRIKLVTQISRRSTAEGERVRTNRRGKSMLYLLEEPTIGLHAHDVERLTALLHRLVDEGGTVVVVEHHLSIAAEADYLIDIGPGAGVNGGKIVSEGTPEKVSRSKRSGTAPFLKEVLSKV